MRRSGEGRGGVALDRLCLDALPRRSSRRRAGTSTGWLPRHCHRLRGSRLPSAETRRASNSSPRGVFRSAEMFQYSSVTKRSISASRSQTRRSATDCNAARGACARQLAPEHGGKIEADEVVESAACEICVDQRGIDVAGSAIASSTAFLVIALKRPLDRFVADDLLLPGRSSTCQEIASPSRSGSVARMRRSDDFTASAMSFIRLAEAPSTSQESRSLSSGRTDPSLQAGHAHGRTEQATL